MAVTNGSYPRYKDGDVSIVMDSTEEYRLHSQVLQFHSSFFANEFERQPGVVLGKLGRTNKAPAFLFEWVPSVDNAADANANDQQEIDEDRGEDGQLDGPHQGQTRTAQSWDKQPGQFVRIELNNSGKRVERKSTPLQPAVYPAGNTTKNPSRFWRWLFGAFYNITVRFDESNLHELVDDCIHLAQYAKFIGSMDHVRNNIDLVLLRQDTKLWTSILKNPALWIEISERVQSPSIFCEAASHILGKWHAMAEEEKDQINTNIREILQRKAEELERAKESLEMRLLGHYPVFLMRTAATRPGRPTYSQDIYMWQCIAFFRQWFAQCISEARTRRASDGGLSFYLCLYKGGQAYLSHLDFQEFHRHFPMSIKACSVLEANMTLFKDDIKPFLEPLIKENTHLKREEYEVITWLTCVDLVKEDLPWHAELEAFRANPVTPNENLDQTYEAVEQEIAQANRVKKSTRASKTAKKPRKSRRVLPPPAGFEPEDVERAASLPRSRAATAARADTANATGTATGPADDDDDDLPVISMKNRRTAARTADDDDDDDDDNLPVRPMKKRRTAARAAAVPDDTVEDTVNDGARDSAKKTAEDTAENAEVDNNDSLFIPENRAQDVDPEAMPKSSVFSSLEDLFTRK